MGWLGISMGFALYPPRLIRIVGSKITELDQICALCIALAKLIFQLVRFLILEF